MRYRRNTEETNFWAGYADCMLALFMIALVLWILSAGVTAFTTDKNKGLVAENERLKDENAKLREDLEKDSDWYAKYKEKEKEAEKLLQLNSVLEARIAQMKALQPKVEALEEKLTLASKWYEAYAELDNLSQVQIEAKKQLEDKVAAVGLDDVEKAKVIDKLILRVDELRSNNNRLVNRIEGLEGQIAVLLEENEKVMVEIAGTGETFESGNAVINKAFRNKLEKVEGAFDTLAQNIKKRKGKVVLEIIGHTDGQPLSSERGNLDTKLPYYLTDNGYEVKNLRPGSNNDLGLLRALAIRKAWASYIESQPNNFILSSVKIHCYSAGQTVPPTDVDLRSPEAYLRKNAASRRIEMRLRNVD